MKNHGDLVCNNENFMCVLNLSKNSSYEAREKIRKPWNYNGENPGG